MKCFFKIYLLLIFFGNILFSQDFIEEEVLVTGSLIKNAKVANPIFEISNEDLNNRGSFRLEDYLNKLPQIYPGNSYLHSNFSQGTSTLSIRGLGANRSLILVDGKRLPSGSPLNAQSEQDLNQVPLALVKKIDLLTGGKSTIYGSDATGGVINFILDNDFNGAKFSMSQGIYQHENNNKALREINNQAKDSVLDGLNSSYSVILGDSLSENSHLIGYISYTKVNEIKWGDRDIGSCAYTTQSGRPPCRGSSATYMSRIQNGSQGGYVSNAGFSSSSISYNFGPDNFLQTPSSKSSLGFLYKYTFDERTNLSVNFFKLDNESLAQIGAPLIFRQIMNIPCTNPYLSSAQYNSLGCTSLGGNISATISKRLVENNLKRIQLFDTSSNRSVLELNGYLRDDWKYQASYQNAHTSLNYQYLNDISLSKVANSLNIDSSGNCISSDSACVPLNLFTTNNNIASSASSGITQAALDYIHLNLFINGEISDNQFLFKSSKEIFINRPLLKSFKLLLGFERREQKISKNPDNNFLNSDGSGQQIQHQKIDGYLNVNEYFAEFSFPMTNELDISSSIRFSDYSFDKSAFTYDFGLIYPLNNFLTLKASHQKSIRMANIKELFDPDETELVYASDPCDGSSPTYNATQCSYTGITNLYGSVDDSSAQLYSRGSGNLNLNPEEAISNSVSFILDLSNTLVAELDFYKIKMKDQISSLSINTVIDNCVTSASNTSYWCNLINRASDGTLSTSGSFVRTPYYNISKFNIEGLDLKISYQIESNLGLISLSNLSNFLINKSFQESIDTLEINCRGLYRNGDESGLCYQPSPKFQNIFSASLEKNINNVMSKSNISIRHIGEVKDAKNIGTIQNLPFDSYTYFDVSLNLYFKDDLDLTLGINNLTDKDPPINGYIGYVPGNANTYPAFYDSLGRFVFLKVSKSLN